MWKKVRRELYKKEQWALSDIEIEGAEILVKIVKNY